jgi:hypothetical protein
MRLSLLPRATAMCDLMDGVPFIVRDRVRVVGDGHPQFGKEGVITEILGVLVPIGPPRAMIRLDDGSGFIIVTLKNLGPAGKFIQSRDGHEG